MTRPLRSLAVAYNYIAMVAQTAKNIESFNDVREIQERLKSGGITLNAEAHQNTEGSASIMLKDPDGNVILVDQHK